MLQPNGCRSMEPSLDGHMGLMDAHNDRDEEQDLKPDILEKGEKKLTTAEALKRDRETYGDSSTSPNREDQEDMHGGSSQD